MLTPKFDPWAQVSWSSGRRSADIEEEVTEADFWEQSLSAAGRDFEIEGGSHANVRISRGPHVPSVFYMLEFE